MGGAEARFLLSDLVLANLFMLRTAIKEGHSEVSHDHSAACCPATPLSVPCADDRLDSCPVLEPDLGRSARHAGLAASRHSLHDALAGR